MRRIAPRGDDGAVAVFVAILIVPVMAFGALVVDVGTLYAEKRQLQNAADAGALAIAQDCAARRATCSSYATTASTMADANSNDGRSAATAALDLGAKEVTVRTSTIHLSGGAESTEMPSIFGGVADPLYDGHEVTAEATVKWGGVGGGAMVPLAFSMCKWESMVALDPVTGGFVLPTAMQTVFLHTDGRSVSDTCRPTRSSTGMTVPGGWGWLDVDRALPVKCEAAIDDFGWTGGDTAPAPPTPTSETGCTTDFFRDLVGETILMPVFDGIRNAPGSSTEYHVAGFAGFELVSYRMKPGSPEYASSPPPSGCPASTSCIRGRFVSYYSADAVPDPTAPDFGATAVAFAD